VQRAGAECKRAPLSAFTANKFIISLPSLAIGVAVIAGFKSQHKSSAASTSAADGPSVSYHLVHEQRAANQASGSGTFARSDGPGRARQLCPCISDLDPLSDFEGIFDLDAKVADGTFDYVPCWTMSRRATIRFVINASR
jgi:hypothetical protein